MPAGLVAQLGDVQLQSFNAKRKKIKFVLLQQSIKVISPMIVRLDFERHDFICRQFHQKNSPFRVQHIKQQAHHKKLTQRRGDTKKKLFVSGCARRDFTNRPDQKSNGLNPGDSANPDTANLCFFAQIYL
jgi:hypothetical protein